MSKFRYIEAYKHYFDEFFEPLPKKIQDKFIWTFELIEDVERVPEKYLKHLDESIFEIRVRVSSNIFRVFAFFDEEKLVILMNGFQKKTQKAPKAELVKAKMIRREYESEK